MADGEHIRRECDDLTPEREDWERERARHRRGTRARWRRVPIGASLWRLGRRFQVRQAKPG